MKTKSIIFAFVFFLALFMFCSVAYAPTLVAGADVLRDGETIPEVILPVESLPATTAPTQVTITPSYEEQNATIGEPVYPHLKEYPTFNDNQAFQTWLNSLTPHEQMEYRMEMQGRAIFSMREGALTEADLDHLVVVALDYETLFNVGSETEGEQIAKEVKGTIVNATPTATIIEFVCDNGVTIHQLCDFVTDLTAGETIDIFVMFDRY